MEANKNPFPIEDLKKQRAKLLAEGYMQTEEFKKEKEKWDEELKNFILYGTPTTCLNEELITEMINYGK